MRVYTGHQRDNPREALFVFARTRRQALEFLVNEDIEVDERSLRVVQDPGAVLFQVGRGRPPEPEELRFEGELPDWSHAP